MFALRHWMISHSLAEFAANLVIVFYVAAGVPAAVQIGYVGPLTGSRAAAGEDARRGIQLALEDLRKEEQSPESQLFEVLFEDSQGDAKRGVAAYQKLQRSGVKIVITQNSNVSLPISSYVNRDGVIQLAITTKTPKYSTPKDNTFRISSPSDLEAHLLAETFRSRIPAGEKSLAIITMEDEYTARVESQLLVDLNAVGLRPAVIQKFNPGEVDFRAIVAHLKAKHIKYVALLSLQAEAGYFVKQEVELGLKPEMVVGITALNNREFFDTAHGATEGVFAAYPVVDSDFPAAKEFEYRFGREVNYPAGNAYDAVKIAYLAAKECRFVMQAECLRRALFAMKDYHGMHGVKKFDDVNGDMSEVYEIRVARDGKFVRRER